MTSRIDCHPGVNTNIFKSLSKVLNNESYYLSSLMDRVLNDEKFYIYGSKIDQNPGQIFTFCNGNEVFVMFKEIEVKPGLFFDGEKIVGFDENNEKFATHAMIFMIRSLRNNWKAPICYYFTNGKMSGKKIAYYLKQVIRRLQKSSFKVIASISNHDPNNIEALEILCCSDQSYFTYKVNGVEIIHFFDVPSLLIGIRNHLVTSNLTFKLDEKQYTADWLDFVRNYNVYSHDQSHIQKICYYGRPEPEIFLSIFEYKNACNCAYLPLPENVTPSLNYHYTCDIKAPHILLKGKDKKCFEYAAQTFSRAVYVSMVIKSKSLESKTYSGFVYLAAFLNQLFDTCNTFEKPEDCLPLSAPINRYNEKDFFTIWEKAIATLESFKFSRPPETEEILANYKRPVSKTYPEKIPETLYWIKHLHGLKVFYSKYRKLCNVHPVHESVIAKLSKPNPRRRRKIPKIGLQSSLCTQILNLDPLENFITQIQGRSSKITAATFVKMFRSLLLTDLSNGLYKSYKDKSSRSPDQCSYPTLSFEDTPRTTFSIDDLYYKNIHYYKVTPNKALSIKEQTRFIKFIFNKCKLRVGKCNRCLTDLRQLTKNKPNIFDSYFGKKVRIILNQVFNQMSNCYNKIDLKSNLKSFIHKFLELRRISFCNKHDLANYFFNYCIKASISKYVMFVNNILRGKESRNWLIKDDMLFRLARKEYLKGSRKYSKEPIITKTVTCVAESSRS